jgi:hypothetical protein
MADQPIRVLFRYHGGVPARQMSDEEKAQSREKIRQIFGEWKSSGVQLIGSWHGCGEGVGGYAHYLILDVDDVETVYRMNGDIYGRLGGTYQRHSFDIGLPPAVEAIWESV